MKRRFVATALTALVFVAVGCGSSSDNGLSKADYIKQADAICKAGNAQLNTAAQGLPAKPTAAQIKALATTVFVPNLEGQLASLKKLKAPKADKDTISQLLTDLGTAVAKVKADPSLLAASGAGPFATANAEATKYGLTVCGASS